MNSWLDTTYMNGESGYFFLHLELAMHGKKQQNRSTLKHLLTMVKTKNNPFLGLGIPYTVVLKIVHTLI